MMYHWLELLVKSVVKFDNINLKMSLEKYNQINLLIDSRGNVCTGWSSFGTISSELGK